MARLRRLTAAQLVLLLLTAGLVGYIIGPSVAAAATSVTQITGFPSGWRANVQPNTRRLMVDNEGTTNGYYTGYANTFSLTSPAGEFLLATGVATSSFAGPTLMTGAVVDNPGSGVVTVIITTTNSSGQTYILWQGTAGPGQHVGDTFDAGVFAPNSLGITVNGTGGRFMIYGDCFTAGCGAGTLGPASSPAGKVPPAGR